jgi:hypothetical protein
MLSNLVFSDLFVSEDAETSWFKSTPDSLVTNPIPLECVEELAALRSELDKREKSSFGHQVVFVCVLSEYRLLHRK